jgi:hypothetical protein
MIEPLGLVTIEKVNWSLAVACNSSVSGIAAMFDAAS